MTSSHPPTVLAIDVGGTTIKAARVDGDGRTQAEVTVPTGWGAEAVDRVLALCRELRDASTVAATVAVAGIIDEENGIVRKSVNLGWVDLPLEKLVHEEVGVPTQLVHDVRAACTAEVALGLGRGTSNFVLIVLGTGLSAGIVASGNLVIGASFSAGEVGHLVVNPQGELCACGQRGCAEVYASAGGLSRRYASLGGDAGVTAARLITSPDPRARLVFDDATDALAKLLAAVAVTLDPELIVLAGGLSKAGDALVMPVRKKLDRELTWRTPPPVHLSALTSRAGLAGAALMAWTLAGVASPELSWSPALAVTAL